MRPEKYALTDCNSCGQGQYEIRPSHPLRTVAESAGYVYSHSTNTGMPDGTWRLYHTFKKAGHNVGFYDDSETKANTSVSCASGHRHYTFSPGELQKHLAGKRKRYKELRGE